ncbi:hypothetical protein GCM10009127_11510 [Alteraurantiacibacter aestuarii]|uniref:Uncharacterized protein n=1 Tax=Alteraurantiacibacter aestuarii TaxID=650004 RepID=A0A844ZIC8_9SPHN|nr:hypothetical protein [Alteraurantiacibacter aestuarii]MXO87538.1 hypothetical protein [Alteraurantiacibacter aestuarii]
MAQTFQFYDDRANEASAEAASATLDNVRERALRSEKAWRGMADQALKIEEDRAQAERDRAERREAEKQAEAEKREQAEQMILAQDG